MTDEKIFALIFQYQNQLEEDLAIIIDLLRDKDDKCFSALQCCPLKDYKLGIVVSIFLGLLGGGAFYANKRDHGVIQLLLLLCYFFMVFLTKMDYMYNMGLINGDVEIIVACFVCYCLSISFILYIIGVINVKKWVKKYNCKKIMEYLSRL